MKMRAAIYARVSTDDQRENYSIPSQIQECISYIEDKGYVLVGDQFVDPDTGHDVPKCDSAIPAFVDDYTSRELSRPSLDTALVFLETVGYDVIVVHALDRLARDPYIRQTLELEFGNRGAKVEFVLGNYEDSPEGEIRKDLDATFAKWENAKRLERCNRGKRRKAESGKFVTGRTPYGYKMDFNSPGGLAIVEDQANVVKSVFIMFVEEGKSMREITKILNSDGIPAHQGGSWTPAVISLMLRNTTYIGHYFYNKRKRNGKRHEKRDEKEWIRIECDPIIDQNLFSQARPVLEQNRLRKRKKPKRFYLFSGMIFCENCGKAYGAETNKDWQKREVKKYRHRVSLGHCINRSIRESTLSAVVWDQVVEILLDPVNLRQGYFDSLEQQKEGQLRQKTHLKRLHKKTGNLEQQRQKLTEIYLDVDVGLTKREYLEQKNRIEVQLRSIQADISSIENTMLVLPAPMDFETLEVFANEINDLLVKNVDPCDKDKRQILELLHAKVLISEEGKIKVTGWFDGKVNKSGNLTRTSRCN